MKEWHKPGRAAVYPGKDHGQDHEMQEKRWERCSATYFWLSLVAVTSCNQPYKDVLSLPWASCPQLALVGTNLLMHEQYCTCRDDLSSLTPTFLSLPGPYPAQGIHIWVSFVQELVLISFDLDDRNDSIHHPFSHPFIQQIFFFGKVLWGQWARVHIWAQGLWSWWFPKQCNTSSLTVMRTMLLTLLWLQWWSVMS